MSDGTDNNAGRDNRGRFAKGNPGGPGGARRRPFELRRALQEVVTPDVATAISRRLTRMSLEGNMPATRLLFEHTVGRPAEAPAEGDALDLHLPPLRTADDCAVAVDMVLQARLYGRINSADAQLLNDLITTRLRAIEAAEHERRLADLEAEARRSEAGAPYTA